MNAFEQGLLRYWNVEQLDNIRRVRIGIAGAGGLGSNCAMLLVRSGFRKFVLADYDGITADNLNRQNFFFAQIGTGKVRALAENLSLINTNLDLRLHQTALTAENMREIFDDCDIVIEAFDDAAAKLILIETFAGTGKTVIAASGIAGYGTSDRIVTKKITPGLYVVGDFATDAKQAAPYAPCVMIAAAKQADLALEIVLKGCDAHEGTGYGQF